MWHSGALHGVVPEQSAQSEAGLSSNPDVSKRNIKKTELSFQRPHGLLSKPPGLRDLTMLHGHSAAAGRILSSWLTVK